MVRIQGPGPHYALPSTVGALNHDPTRTQAPAFSFGVRTRVSNTQPSSPGPKYNIRGVNEHGRFQSQQTSLSGRVKVKLIHTPGPNSYNAQMTEVKAPSYSFGMRRPNRWREKTGPGPNKYVLPACIGPKIPHMKSVPAYSILSRSFGYIKQHQTPGPKYILPAPTIYLKKPPQANLLGRCKQKYNNGTPGPNKYDPKPTYKKREALKGISFGIKHSFEKQTVYLPEDKDDVFVL